MSIKNKAAPQHFGFIICTLTSKTVGICHAPGNETNLFLQSTKLFSVWDTSVNEDQSRGREYEGHSKIIFFPIE